MRAFFGELGIVMVLYKSTLEDAAAFQSLRKALPKNVAVPDFYVFDNSPNPVYPEGMPPEWSFIQYRHDPTNPGLSKPSNEGVARAAANGKKWILFTNPDTEYPREYFQALLDAVSKQPDMPLLVPVLLSESRIVSPAAYRFFIGRSPSSVTYGGNDMAGKLVLYSGMCISVTAFYKAGGFNDKIKLDFMDNFFTERYAQVYPAFFLLDIRCQHHLSSSETNVQKVLQRFRFYCEGARQMATGRLVYLWLLMVCMGRALKFTMRFRNAGFVSTVSKVFFQNIR